MVAQYAGKLPHSSTGFLPLSRNETMRVNFRTMDSGIKQRIEQRLRELDLTPRAASLKAGGSGDLIRGLLRGKQQSFRGDNLAKLADVLGVSVSWLLTGEHEHIPSEDVAAGLPGNVRVGRQAVSSLENYKGEIPGAVPEVDARAGAGPGQVGDPAVVTLRRDDIYSGHRVISEWLFPSAFLRHELRVQPSSILVLEVIGDSMSPTLDTGDRVLVDTSHARPTPDGVYVIEEGDGPLVKRLQIVRRSDPPEVMILSDNPNHKPYTLKLDQIRIIGRVSGRFSRM